MEFMDLFFFLHAISGFYRRGYTMDYYGLPARSSRGGKLERRVFALAHYLFYVFVSC